MVVVLTAFFGVFFLVSLFQHASPFKVKLAAAVSIRFSGLIVHYFSAVM